MVYGTVPLTSGLSRPVTITVWGTFQSAAVNVSWAVETVPTAGSLDRTPTTTGASGSLVSTTWNDAVRPAVVSGADVGVTWTPATSRSWLVRETLAARPW